MHSLRNDAMPYVTQGCSFKCMYKPLVQHRICTPNHLKTVKFVKSVTISQQRLSNKYVPIEKPMSQLRNRLHSSRWPASCTWPSKQENWAQNSFHLNQQKRDFTSANSVSIRNQPTQHKLPTQRTRRLLQNLRISHRSHQYYQGFPPAAAILVQVGHRNPQFVWRNSSDSCDRS